jgi:hypothetical protein
MEVSPLEEDLRMVLHTAHIATHGYQYVLISSVDTDVFVMSLAYHVVMQAKLFQKCKTKACAKSLVMEKIAKSVGTKVS